MIYYCKDCETFYNNDDFLFGYYKHSEYQIKQCNICKYYSNLTSRPWYDILCCCWH